MSHSTPKDIPIPLGRALETAWPPECIACGRFNVTTTSDLALGVLKEASRFVTEDSEVTLRWRIPICRSCESEHWRRTVLLPGLIAAPALVCLALRVWLSMNDIEDPPALLVAIVLAIVLAVVGPTWLQRRAPAHVAPRQEARTVVFAFRSHGYADAFERLNADLWKGDLDPL